MRRLTVVQLVPALNHGGAERTTLDIARALVAARHRSIVISAGGGLLHRLLGEGSEHFPLPLAKKSLAVLRHARALRALLEQLRPDIVHVRSRYPAWVLRFALRGLAQPPRIVSTVHGLNSSGFYSGILTQAERVICVSDTVRAHVLKQWPDTSPDKLVVIERGLDASEFHRGVQAPLAWRQQLWREHPQLHGSPLLLMPARGTRLKGHRDAIELLAALRAQGHDARLWLLGVVQEGREDYLRELETLAERLQLTSYLRMSPARQDVRLAYAACDLVLQLSRQPESFGRTVLEAIAIGRPVVGYAHGGVGDLLHRHFPIGAVPVGDATRLLQVVSQVLREQAMPAPLPDTLALMQERTLDEYHRLCP